MQVSRLCNLSATVADHIFRVFFPLAYGIFVLQLGLEIEWGAAQFRLLEGTPCYRMATWD